MIPLGRPRHPAAYESSHMRCVDYKMRRGPEATGMICPQFGRFNGLLCFESIDAAHVVGEFAGSFASDAAYRTTAIDFTTLRVGACEVKRVPLLELGALIVCELTPREIGLEP